MSEAASRAAQKARDEITIRETRAALAKAKGSRPAAVEILGISKQSLYKRLSKFPQLVEEFPVKPGRPPTHAFTCAEVIDALQRSNGHRGEAAELLGCSQFTIYEFLRVHAWIAERYPSKRKESTED